MELSVAIELIKKYTTGHNDFVMKADIAERYYRNKTDILLKRAKSEEDKNIRNADNRVSSSFYSLLVNQKASYIFTAPPLFDVGEKSANKVITEVLGDAYAKKCKDLCIDASNTGIAWVHYWINDNEFKWAVVSSQQIIPIYNNDLDKRLLSVLRCYDEIDESTGKTLYIYEIWNDKECVAFKKEANSEFDKITYYNKFEICNTLTGIKEPTNAYKHNFGKVPFIPFANNNINMSDLENIKGLIDTYDKVYSGFVNDLEDIQEIIFILTGYEGEDLGEFLGNLKKYKTVKLDSDIDVKGDLKTLTIDIPVEAREKLLTMTRKAIFEQGQGVDPEPGNFGNASGVALQYLYSLLELKAGLLETEFRLGLSELVRAICDYKGIACGNIVQTWTRTSIRNDVELSEIARNSKGIISDNTIIKNHPWVEDPEKEIKEIQKQEKDLEGKYSQPVRKVADNNDDEG